MASYGCSFDIYLTRILSTESVLAFSSGSIWCFMFFLPTMIDREAFHFVVEFLLHNDPFRNYLQEFWEPFCKLCFVLQHTFSGLTTKMCSHQCKIRFSPEWEAKRAQHWSWFFPPPEGEKLYILNSAINTWSCSNFTEGFWPFSVGFRTTSVTLFRKMSETVFVWEPQPQPTRNLVCNNVGGGGGYSVEDTSGKIVFHGREKFLSDACVFFRFVWVGRTHLCWDRGRVSGPEDIFPMQDTEVKEFISFAKAKAWVDAVNDSFHWVFCHENFYLVIVMHR